MKYNFIEEDLHPDNSVYLEIEFMDGDGDVYETEEYPMGSYESFEDIEKSTVIDEQIIQWLQIKDTLEPEWEYESYAEEHGEELADIIDNIPNGPMCDFQFKMTVSSIYLVYYKNNKKYKTAV